mmetsp:Transcript_89236/g.257329  ORF Transcript_89236/g.257329 Transcript_89236/m.257329 type:complete len:101 (+) Transcript_89236:793-1095(+)
MRLPPVARGPRADSRAAPGAERSLPGGLRLACAAVRRRRPDPLTRTLQRKGRRGADAPASLLYTSEEEQLLPHAAAGSPTPGLLDPEDEFRVACCERLFE